MSKIQPLPRPALIPDLAPGAAKPPSAGMKAIRHAPPARDPAGLAERAGRTEGGDRQSRIVTFETIKEREIADAKVSV
jgi:hypothetical protein